MLVQHERVSYIFWFLLTGNLAQAEAVGREALELIPNDHSLMFSLANVLGKSQKYKVRDLQAVTRSLWREPPV